MSYLIVHFWPGGTQEQYDATVAAVHPPNGLPEGQIHHAAGPTDGGMLISTLWDSKEQADRFVAEKLMGAGPIDGGFSGGPEERAAEVSNLLSA